ncbi:hypothetical protein F0B66_22920 [Salmonella enterica]|nr:hypothetical protein [Salmonella enterica]
MKIHCLLPVLVSASVCSQPLTVAPAHWQEGMAVGVTELSGTLYIRETAWQWQPVSLELSQRNAVQAGLQAEDVVITVPGAQRQVELRTDAPAELEVPANYRGNVQVPVEVEGVSVS